MPEDNTTPTPTPSMPPVDSSAAVAEPETSVAADAAFESNNPVVVEPTSSPAPEKGNVKVAGGDIYNEVAGKIRDSKNVLIALSSDPSVDEMAAAIGLSLYLDKLGKRATAIYSGATPNALEFLKPEETFESSADTLQDFVIALSKEKADHLRYKLDGDFVKIYITPYKARISEDDLDFSYGDFNVDLVLALDVSNGIDLDSALREHGRIMHDAVIINVTTGNPGKFGEIEWSDKHASSVSEMIAKLLYNVSGAEISKEEATAFLTGIVAATNRFSNAGTTPETMQIASQLMESGANQQLVSKNITPDIENEMVSLDNEVEATADNGEVKESPREEDLTSLDIVHKNSGSNEETAEKDATPSGDDTAEKDEGVEKVEEGEKNEEAKKDEGAEKGEEKPEIVKNEDESGSSGEDNSLLEDLKAAEESLSQTGAEAVPEAKEEAVKIDSENGTSNMDEIKPDPSLSAEEHAIDAPVQEKVLQPSDDLGAKPMTMEDESKYGKMLEDALNDVNGGGAENTAAMNASTGSENPAAMNAPAVPENPEINGVPEMNYMPMPDEQILPPPPTPPIDMSGAMPTNAPATPAVESTAPVMPSGPIEPAAPVTPPEPTSLGEQPAMQDQVYESQGVNAGADPGAFKIPGM